MLFNLIINTINHFFSMTSIITRFNDNNGLIFFFNIGLIFCDAG